MYTQILLIRTIYKYTTCAKIEQQRLCLNKQNHTNDEDKIKTYKHIFHSKELSKNTYCSHINFWKDVEIYFNPAYFSF